MKKLIGSEGRLAMGIALLFAVMSISNSCTKSSMDNTGGTGDKGGSGSPGTNEVWIQGMAFDPATITITAGTTITWTNKDAVVHNVVSDSGLFDSGSMSNGAVFSYKFTSAGTYPYSCTIHPSMVATVVVN